MARVYVEPVRLSLVQSCRASAYSSSISSSMTGSYGTRSLRSRRLTLMRLIHWVVGSAGRTSWPCVGDVWRSAPTSQAPKTKSPNSMVKQRVLVLIVWPVLMWLAYRSAGYPLSLWRLAVAGSGTRCGGGDVGRRRVSVVIGLGSAEVDIQSRRDVRRGARCIRRLPTSGAGAAGFGNLGEITRLAGSCQGHPRRSLRRCGILRLRLPDHPPRPFRRGGCALGAPRRWTAELYCCCSVGRTRTSLIATCRGRDTM